jgi:hypothetical protein
MKKFIKTTDNETANKLTTYGFKLITHIGDIYTFLNEVPTTFNFEAIDEKKIVYDDKLSL